MLEKQILKIIHLHMIKYQSVEKTNSWFRKNIFNDQE